MYHRRIRKYRRWLPGERGWQVHDYTGICTRIESILLPYNLWMMLVKAGVFSFILTSVSCYQGYYVKGGSIELGKASTNAVVVKQYPYPRSRLPHRVNVYHLIMIKADQIIKSFGEQQVIKNLTLEFETGKTNLVIGRSGSGKTVLLKMLVGLIKPDSGRILYDNEDFTALMPKSCRPFACG